MSCAAVQDYLHQSQSSLTATVLTENTQVDGLSSEHGLCVYVAYGDLRLLLDFGQSDVFARNADALGVNLADVDLAVLSHAHYDHADGMEAFFACNSYAPLYLSETCAENCWSTKGGTAEAHYIGIQPGLLERYRDRLVRVELDHVHTIAPGVHMVPHTSRGLAALGEHAGMMCEACGHLVPDGFAHEMSLVIEVGDGLAVFSSCSHAGLPAITSEVQEAFPRRRITAFVGGLHLVHASDAEILQVAEVIRNVGIDRLYTGHCTGALAFELLARELPGLVSHLYPGLTFSLSS